MSALDDCIDEVRCRDMSGTMHATANEAEAELALLRRCREAVVVMPVAWWVDSDTGVEKDGIPARWCRYCEASLPWGENAYEPDGSWTLRCDHVPACPAPAIDALAKEATP